MSLIFFSARNLVAVARSFSSARQGNVAIIFALSLVPLVGLVGLGMDYGVALTDKSKLDNAADAAALSAVSTAKAYVAANQSDSNLVADAIAAGNAQAPSVFMVNAGNIPFAAIPTPTITLTFQTSNQTFYSVVTYTTNVQNHFGQIFNRPTIPISGTSQANSQLPSYLDFYLLMDVSGSMGLPSTQSGQSTLMANNSGCQFACHFPGQTSGYNYAINNNIQLRSGAVNSAVCGLLTLAASPSVPNQYRVGLYPFVTNMATLSPLSTNFAALNLAATCSSNPPTALTSLLDTGTTQDYTGNNPSTGTGAGGTHFETTMPQMQTTISSFGNGSSSAKSRPFVFLITDGMQNSQFFDTVQNGTKYYPGNPSTFGGYAAANWTGSSPAAMDYTQCTALKNAGATISVLYIPYQTLTLGTQNQGETIAADNAIPNLPTALQNCATSGYFYTANTPADINNALANMFNQAIAVSHLTQ